MVPKNQRVHLRPHTARMRQLVRAFGPAWIVMDRASVPCFDGEIGIYIASLCGKHQRWVRPHQIEALHDGEEDCCYS